MAVFSNTNVLVLVDAATVSGFADQFSLTGEADVLDFTALQSGGWRTKKLGLAKFGAKVHGFQDYAATGLNPLINVTSLGGSNVLTVAPTGGANVADPAFLAQGLLSKYQPLSGQVGTPADFDMEWAGTAQCVRGQMLHPVAVRTATGNGTATAFTPPSASQSLYASFHVQAVSGAGSITFVVETDTVIGMGTATTRITSNAFAAIGAQFASVAGAITGGFIRVRWTITGFTSVTFAVAAGVL